MELRIAERSMVVVLVVGVMLLSGCMSGSPAETATTTTESTETGTVTTTTTASATTSGAVATTDQYAFAEGETYTYALVNQDREFVWQVTEVVDAKVTVEVMAEGSDGGATTLTYMGTQSDTTNTLFTNTSRPIPIFGTLHNAVAITEAYALENDTSWTVTQEALPRLFAGDWETATATVTDTGSINGIQYQNVTITPENGPDVSATFQVNQAYPFALGWSSTGSATAIDTGVLRIQSSTRETAP